MARSLTRRELIFREIPRAAAAGFGLFGAGRLLAEPLRKHIGLGEFANQLLIQHWDRLLKIRKKEFGAFCRLHGLDRQEESVSHSYVAASLFHELIRKGGILGNRYMLIDQRPERVLRIEKGILRPLEEDELKLRGPGRMLSDMFSGKPRYMLESGRRIYCFGDCDEYEMAYVTVLRAVGLDARIVMSEASHVKTQVSVGGVEILVDNTRNNFGQEAECRGRCKNHRTGEAGYLEPWKAKRYVGRINRLAAAEGNVRIWPKGEKRVEQEIERWLDATGISKGQEKTGASPSSQTGHRAGAGKE